jgi:O-antigen ligase
MRAHSVAPLAVPRALIVAIALAGSVAAGSAMAQSARLGAAVAVALCYATLVLLDLRLGVVLWIPTVSLIAVAALDVGPNLAGCLILFAWFGAFAARDSDIPAIVVEHRRFLIAAAAIAAWALLSMAWTFRPRLGSDIFFGWIATVAIALVISTTLTDRRSLRWAATAFVVGAVISVAVGLVGGAVHAPADGTAAAAARVVGGSGDPNFLAAGIVPAIVLAFALAAGTRHPVARVAVLPVAAFLTVGLIASQSRGGLVAALVAALAALVLAKRRRGWVAMGLLWVAGAAAAWYVADPVAWERLSDFNESSGRGELWNVAWRMWQDHPVAGVGLQGFLDASGDYARALGPLKYAEFITEQPHVVHNSVLELLAETGIVGLGLFLAVVAISLSCAHQAARRFEQIADAAMVSLSKAVIVSVLASLTAAMFISSETDRRIWVLLALGPALLAAARRAERASVVAGSRARSG